MAGWAAMLDHLIKSLSTAMIWQLKWDQIKTNLLQQTSNIDVILKLMVKVFFGEC